MNVEPILYGLFFIEGIIATLIILSMWRAITKENLEIEEEVMDVPPRRPPEKPAEVIAISPLGLVGKCPVCLKIGWVGNMCSHGVKLKEPEKGLKP